MRRDCLALKDARVATIAVLHIGTTVTNRHFWKLWKCLTGLLLLGWDWDRKARIGLEYIGELELELNRDLDCYIFLYVVVQI